MNLVLVAREVESRKAFQPKFYISRDCADPPNNLMVVGGHIVEAMPLDRHKIDKLGNPIGAIKPSDEDVGIRQIKLLATLRGNGGDLKVSPLFIIENRRKDAGRIEVGQTTPIDGAIDTYQGNGVEVTDDTIVFNGFVRHSYSPFTGIHSQVSNWEPLVLMLPQPKPTASSSVNSMGYFAVQGVAAATQYWASLF